MKLRITAPIFLSLLLATACSSTDVSNLNKSVPAPSPIPPEFSQTPTANVPMNVPGIPDQNVLRQQIANSLGNVKKSNTNGTRDK